MIAASSECGVDGVAVRRCEKSVVEIAVGGNYMEVTIVSALGVAVMNRSPLADGVRHLRGVLALQCHSEESDEQLLHALRERRDDSAFAVLMRRHGPMVLHVCRRVLGNEQDAEDAFQATFLVLARGTAGLRRKTALASFLHGTAYRVALSAKRAAGRRRKHEGARGALTQPRSPVDPVDELSGREVRTLLDEEIAQLPDLYRSVFILCYLENLSRPEAARRLGLTERTVLSRLTEARKRLARRLARRGVELTAVLAAALATQTASALPIGLMIQTMEGVTQGVVPASVAALATGALATGILSKTKIAAVVLLAAATLSGASVWWSATPQARIARPAETAKEVAEPSSRRKDAAVAMVKGRVVLPDGKPAAQAVITRRQLKQDGTALQDTMLTATDAEGRFAVEHRETTTLIASKPGYAPDWTEQRFAGGEVTLRLAERAHVRGRLLSLEGKPIAGAGVKVLGVKVPVRGNLKAVVDAFRLNPEWTWQAMPKGLSGPFPQSTTEAKTDADGRFTLEGFGINRILEILFEGEGIESAKVQVILAKDFDPKAVRRRPAERSYTMSPSYHPAVYGPEFTHTVRPCQVLTGKVVDEDTGKPIAGVTITGTARSIRWFDNAAWNDAVACVTDREGRYRLSGLPKTKGRHLFVRSSAAPYLDRLLEVPDTAAYSPQRVEIKLTKAVTVEGRLVDQATAKGVCSNAIFLPLESEALTRFLADHPAYNPENSGPRSGVRIRGHSDAEGRFKLYVPPVPGVILAGADTFRAPAARYAALQINKEDRKYLRKPPREEKGMPKLHRTQGAIQEEFFATHRELIPVHWFNGYALIRPTKKDETVITTIRLNAGRTLHGKIVGPEGQPLRSVQAVGIQATDEHGPTTFPTDAYTVYALDPSRQRTVYFLHKAKNLVGTLTLKGDETKAPLVKMQAAATVVGRVLDVKGKALADMDVSIQLTDAIADMLIRQTLYRGADSFTTTDAEGRFRLQGMFSDLELTVYAQRPGHRSSDVAFEPVTLQAGEIRDLGDFQEKPAK
jgi:RNA polymerase sigma factor (sigma-70 family)